MNRKRFLALVLATALVFGNLFTVQAAGQITPGGRASNNFAQAVARITQQYSNDNIFSSIILDVGSTVMAVDGTEVEIIPAVWDGEALMLPVVDIAEAIGASVEVNEKSGNMTITTAEGTTVIEAESMSSAQAATLGGGKSLVSSHFERGIYTEFYNDGSSMTRYPYASIDDVKDAMDIEVAVSGDKVMLTAPYQTKRVIVFMEEGETLRNFYGAIDYAYDGDGLYLLQYSTQADAREACESLRSEHGVLCAEPNGVARIFGDFVASDDLVELGNGISLVVGEEYETSAVKAGGKTVQADAPELPYGGNWGTERINADLIKEALGGNGAEVIVAVVDTGADVNHEFLKDRMVAGYNFVNNTANPNDGNGHGTHVSGTIVDCTPANVKVMPIKALTDEGYGEDITIITAIKWAVDNGADVINMSFGGSDIGYGCLYGDALRYVTEHGVVPVVAAGNDAIDVDEFEICPAHLEESVTVSATNRNDMLANFSNYGASIDICAPGSEILSAQPGGAYTWMSGTSMSAPHVAASAALLISENPGSSADEIRQALYNTTVDLGYEGKDDLFGYGVVDFRIHLNYESVPPTSFSLSPTTMELTLNQESNKGFFRVEVEPFEATNKSYYVTSSDESVASFENGYVLAKGVGSATLTITSVLGGFEATCEVNVEESGFWIDYYADEYDAGDGSADHPYEIATAEQLAKLLYEIRRGNLYGNISYPPPSYQLTVTNQKYFRLTADIDLAGKEWMPIGYVGFAIGTYEEYDPFLGHFDGNGHTISNINIGKYKYNANAGFFAATGFNEIKNLGLINVDISKGMWYTTGAMVGESQGSTFTQCYVTGKTEKGSGFAGQVYGVSFYDCFTTVDSSEGGFAYNFSDDSVAYNCYSAGNAQIRGGFAVTTTTIGTEYVGLVNSFSAGITPKGGFIDERRDINGDVLGCYYNEENANGIAKNNTTTGTTDITAVPLSFFKESSNFTNPDNWQSSHPWDFENIWDIDPAINGGLPILKTVGAPVDYGSGDTGTWIDFASDSYAGGHGTLASPYQIETPEQLARIAKNYRFSTGGMYFEIMNDIDLAGHDWFPLGGGDTLNTEAWDPMLGASFNGNLIGNGHTISNVTINGRGVGLGFIGFMVGGTVDDLHLANVNINGDNYAGGMVGIGMYGIITNSSVTGIVKGMSHVGGLIGYTMNAVVKGSSASVELYGNTAIGGLIGSSYESLIERCYSSSTYGVNSPAAALAFTNTGIIRDSYAFGVGSEGLVASNFYGKVENSYFVGSESGFYYGVDRRVKSGTPIELSALQNVATFADWDFDTIWGIDPEVNGGYPYVAYPVESETPLDTYWKDYAASGPNSGEGTAANPYVITTAEELAWMIKVYDPNGDYSPAWWTRTYYELANDIDLGAHNWYSIGVNEYGPQGFSIVFNGNGHTLKNVKFKPIFDDAYGFIGALGYDGEIMNLNLEVSGDSMAGLVYNNSQGYIHDVSISGFLINSNTLMALAPIATGNWGRIERCYSDCVLLGNSIGGIVYWNDDNMDPGVYDDSVYLQDSYSTSTLLGAYAGGISTFNAGTVRNCYYAGEIFGGPSGAFIEDEGYGYGRIINSYFDEEFAFSGLTSGRPYGKSTEFMKNQENYTGWDFNNVWFMDSSLNNGYPVLRAHTELYTVTFEANNGEPATTQTVAPGSIVAPPDVVWEGYIFRGWHTDAEEDTPYDFGTPVTSDLTLYAHWESEPEFINLEGENGSFTMYFDKLIEEMTIGSIQADTQITYRVNGGELAVLASECLSIDAESKSASFEFEALARELYEDLAVTVYVTYGGQELSYDFTVEHWPEVTGIDVSASALTVISVRSVMNVSYTVTPAAAEESIVSVEWSSSNPTIASVEDGVISALKTGMVVITLKVTTIHGTEISRTFVIRVA